MMSDDDFVDFYDLIGVEPEAAAEDINRAYKKKALKLHPDKNPDDPNAGKHVEPASAIVFNVTKKFSGLHAATLFQAVSKAKDLLLDPESRAKFDRVRTARAQKEARFKELNVHNQKLRTGTRTALADTCHNVFNCYMTVILYLWGQRSLKGFC